MPSRRILRNSERHATPNVRENNLPDAVPDPVKTEKSKPPAEEEWDEPPLQNVPSYVQQGLDKNSLFEYMQPLGAPPPPALLAKLKLKVNTAAGKKSTVGKKNQTSATPEVTTPTDRSNGSRNMISVKGLSGKDIRIDMNVFNTPKTPDSDSYNLGADGSPKELSTPPHHISKNGAITPPNQTSPRESLTRTPQQKNDMDLVVNHCVDELKANDKDTTGLAVKRIYEDSHYDQEKCNLIEAILYDRADKDQKRIFAVELKSAKSAIRAERRASKRVAELQHSPIQSAQAKSSSPPLATDMAEPVSSGTDSQPMSRNPSSSSNASLSEMLTQRTTTLSGIQTRSSRRIAKLTGDSATSPSEKPKPVVKITEKPKMNPPSTPIPRETRSRARRDSSSSDLSSVDEKIVSADFLASPFKGSKRSATDAGLIEESEEEMTRRKKVLSELEIDRTHHEGHVGKLSDVRSIPRNRSGITLSFNRTTRSRKRPLDDGESLMATPLASPNPESLSVQQSARPSAAPELPKAKRIKVGGARTKISPMKNRTTHAGIPRTKRNGPKIFSRQATPSRGNEDGGDNDEETQDRNFDHCVACGEGGNLVCCDGCENSFHFRCCDPPLASHAGALDEPYYCYACSAADLEPDIEPSPGGPFDGLFIRLNGTNTASFQLPREIRTYFDGVKSQSNGEYVDTTEPRIFVNGGKTRSANTTLDEQTETKPTYPTCYSCKETSYPNRSIIQCDVQGCSAHWHLDCLDPPRSNPPATSGKTRVFFRCPLHVENDLKLMSNSLLGAETQERIHRLRPVKHPQVIQPTIERGNRNNGIIEIEGVDEDLAQPDGVVYALGAKSVILDFITRAKRQRNENSFSNFQQHLDQTLASVNPNNMTERLQSLISTEVERQVNQRMEALSNTEADFVARPRAEQDMVMFLTSFATVEQEARSVDADNIATLSRAATATDPVGTASTLDIDELKKLQSVISQALALKEVSIITDSSTLQDESTQVPASMELDDKKESGETETVNTAHYNHAQEATLKLFNATNTIAIDSPDATGATEVDSPSAYSTQASAANGVVVGDSVSATGAETENSSAAVGAMAAPTESEETLSSLASKNSASVIPNSLAVKENMSTKEEPADIQDVAELDADDGGVTSTASQSSPPSIMDVSPHEKGLKEIDSELTLPSAQPVRPVNWPDSPPMIDDFEERGTDIS